MNHGGASCGSLWLSYDIVLQAQKAGSAMTDERKGSHLGHLNLGFMIALWVIEIEDKR